MGMFTVFPADNYDRIFVLVMNFWVDNRPIMDPYCNVNTDDMMTDDRWLDDHVITCNY